MSFIVDLQAEWAVPISLALGPTDGISYRTQNSTKVKQKLSVSISEYFDLIQFTKMASFENVLSILTTKSNSDERGLLKLNIAGSSEVVRDLLFLFSSKHFFVDFNLQLSITFRCDRCCYPDRWLLYAGQSKYSVTLAIVN